MPLPATAADIRITDVIAYPMVRKTPGSGGTSWKNADRTAIVIVEVRTDAGITGIGETLGRFGSTAYADAVASLFKPKLMGKSPLAIIELQKTLRRVHSGRAGGMTGECMAGLDIALWDILGKLANLPISALLGGGVAQQIPCYAGSLPWNLPDSEVERQVSAYQSAGFTAFKVKFGGPVRDAIKRLELVRKLVGDNFQICADANWAFTLDEAVLVGQAMGALGYFWFEEPLPPEDVEGYKRLRDKVPVALAGGESDYNGWQSNLLIASRAVGYVQPNVTRAGGITETRRIYDLAHVNHVAYAPHNGSSGIICDIASLHLAAAAPNLFMVEAPARADPFKSDIGSIKPAWERQVNGMVTVPDGPGLGLELDWDLVAHYAPAA